MVEIPPSDVLAAETVPVEEEPIPLGEIAFHEGANVEASDGWVGRIDEFLVDPDSQEITHLVLRKGHLWDKKEISLPILAIDRVRPFS